jgi:hypothetical protein
MKKYLTQEQVKTWAESQTYGVTIYCPNCLTPLKCCPQMKIKDYYYCPNTMCLNEERYTRRK